MTTLAQIIAFRVAKQHEKWTHPSITEKVVLDAFNEAENIAADLSVTSFLDEDYGRCEACSTVVQLSAPTTHHAFEESIVFCNECYQEEKLKAETDGLVLGEGEE